MKEKQKREIEIGGAWYNEDQLELVTKNNVFA